MDKLKLAYICSPYRAYGCAAVEDNVRRVHRYSRFAVRGGYIPIAPHTIFTQFLDDSMDDEREAGLFMGKQLLLLCDEVWIFGSYISEGMDAEIRIAKHRDVTIRRFNTKCEELTE